MYVPFCEMTCISSIQVCAKAGAKTIVASETSSSSLADLMLMIVQGVVECAKM